MPKITPLLDPTPNLSVPQTYPAPKEDYSPLYQAQHTAAATLQSEWFPCYTPEHVHSLTGLKGKIIWAYSKCYDGVALVGQGLDKTIAAISYVFSYIFLPVTCVGNFLFGRIITQINNAVFPINPINGKRRFVGIPRRVEKFLGDWIIYPLTSFQFTTIQPTPGSLAEKVNTVFKRLQTANQELLNPQKERVHFNYRVRTVRSSQVNAFAVPGGRMVMFSELVEKLQSTINRREIQEVTVHFADGSTAKVDVSNITLDDALAAVLGHEMTHVASRHSMASLLLHGVCTLFANIGRMLFLEILKINDTEYQGLKKKETLSASEKQSLHDKEKFYSSIDNLFQWVEEKIRYLFSMLNSQKHEYEADVTGTYFSQKAGFNPLGALYLQELFLRDKNCVSDFLHKHFELLFSHPYGENRKRAIFAAINEFDPKTVKPHVTWQLANKGYDYNRSGKAIRYAQEAAGLQRKSD